jgi:hypothetical protein
MVLQGASAKACPTGCNESLLMNCNRFCHDMSVQMLLCPQREIEGLQAKITELTGDVVMVDPATLAGQDAKDHMYKVRSTERCGSCEGTACRALRHPSQTTIASAGCCD